MFRKLSVHVGQDLIRDSQSRQHLLFRLFTFAPLFDLPPPKPACNHRSYQQRRRQPLPPDHACVAPLRTTPAALLHDSAF
jgi:hypothetical protein